MQRAPLSGVSVFLAAARSRTFTEAAERLSLTKSVAGKIIARLEDRFNLDHFIPGAPAARDTIHKSVVDADGNAVCLTHLLAMPLGITLGMAYCATAASACSTCARAALAASG